MPVPSRRYTMREIAFELESTVRREGRTNCPVTKWAQDHLHVTEHDFEAWLVKHPVYAAPTCADIIRFTGHYNTPQTTAEIQRLYADHLVNLPWESARPAIEHLLRGEEACQGIDALAMRTLVQCLEKKHPNPKAFLMQPDVVGKVHESIDLTHLPAPDFPHLHGVIAHGGRAG